MADRVLVIGVGPDGQLATPLPHHLTLLVGGRRHLAVHAPAGVRRESLSGELTPALACIAATPGTVAVLASGDPGWFGIVRALAATFGAEVLEVHPAVSAVAAAFAGVGLPWDDAVVVSAHGRDARAAVAAAIAHPCVAVMTDPQVGPAALARTLRACGVAERRVVVAARLGHADETWHDTTLDRVADWADDAVADPNVVLLLDEDRAEVARRSTVAHTAPRRAWGRPAAAFDHRDGQITKPAVRAVALAHLAPATGRLVWDVGCGSGSVAVEAAGLGAGVIAVDRDPEQVARTRANAAAVGVGVATHLGAAASVLAALPTPDADPDAVFVGGGGDQAEAVLDLVVARCRDRLVVALATLERVGPTLTRLRDAGWDARAQQLQAHELLRLGDGHRLAPRNPVLLVLAERP